MKNSFLFFSSLVLLFIHCTIIADTSLESKLLKQPCLFVSLGSDCWTADLLKRYSLRDAAFPFDWIQTFDNHQFIQCLDDQFEFFTHKSFFVRYCETALNHLKNYYKFVFLHDWPYDTDDITDTITEEQNTTQLSHINEKYQRRINRFKKLREYKGKVFFLRCFRVHLSEGREQEESWGWNAEGIIQLNNALKRFFPDTDFTLVSMSYPGSGIPGSGSIDNILFRQMAPYEFFGSMFSELCENYL